MYENRIKGQLYRPGLSPELGTGASTKFGWVFCRLQRDGEPGGMCWWVAIRVRSGKELEGGNALLEG